MPALKSLFGGTFECFSNDSWRTRQLGAPFSSCLALVEKPNVRKQMYVQVYFFVVLKMKKCISTHKVALDDRVRVF